VKTFLKKSLCASLDVLGFQNEIKRAYQDKREMKLLHELEETLRAAANDLEDMGSRNSQILVVVQFRFDLATSRLKFPPRCSRLSHA